MNPFVHGWRNPAVMNIGGSKGSSSVQPVGTQTTVQKSEPWEEQKPYLRDTFIRAEQVANKPLEYYPGSTVVPFSGQTQDALAAMEGRARSGSDLLNTGRDTMTATARGDFLNPESNPYLRKTYDDAARPMVENYRAAVAPGIDAGATRAGRYGSGAWNNEHSRQEDNLGRSLGDLSNSIYGGNYQAERGRQMTAAGMAPEYAQSDYMDAQMLGNVGAQREAQAGRDLQDQVNRWDFNQNEEASRLGNYAALVQGNYGRTEQTSQPIYKQSGGSDWLSGLLGAGMLGSAFAPMFSSKKLKDKGPQLDMVSEKVAGMEVPTWNYKGDETKHMGPMAEDFREKFGIGDGVTLNPVDMFGVMMKSNQELAQRVKRLEHGKHWGA